MKMATPETLKKEILSASLDERLKKAYVTEENVKEQYDRYINLINEFEALFGKDRDVRLFSAPGRTEVGGNHTDHNHGRVLAAGINLDAIAAASKNDAGFKKYGYKIGGFDATTASRVIAGSGLSSSAAYEVLVGTMVNYLYNDGKVDAVTIAKIAQYAENEYFGKPCGLMDQMACSVGGFVTIDFNDPKNPVIEEVDFDFAKCGHSLCIVDTKGSHSDLTDEYAAIRTEMESVAEFFGKKVLREVSEEEFKSKIRELRTAVGDRAILRAMHFYADNARVLKEVDALRGGDFETFKKYILESGSSSYKYNQNVFSVKQPSVQPVSLALAVSESILKGRGAWRVHGGGFAGTIQAFVPNDLLKDYKSIMESIFGEGTCYVLYIRPVGGTEI